MAKGKISRLVIQALKEIGNGKVTAEEENKIIDLLKKEEDKDLKHDIALAPVWVQKIMIKALKDGKQFFFKAFYYKKLINKTLNKQ